MVNIIGKRNIWLGISGVAFALALVALSIWHLKLGIDFTGGSLLMVDYKGTPPSQEELYKTFESKDIKDVEIKSSGDHEMIFRFKTVDQPTHAAIVEALNKQGELTEKDFESIGPSIGAELQGKSWKAILLAVFLILLYITYAFRRVSRPVESWKYGVSAILALAHDLVILLGVFAVLGKVAGIEINSSFIAAFLTVLGFSVHDTIVVFDRTRENLLKYSGEFEGIVNRSLNETLVRSINTSLTVMLVLGALYFFGGESIRSFALALLIGVGAGTYSSIFVASPLLVIWHTMTQQAKEKK